MAQDEKTTEGTREPKSPSAPSISLPKGGGAVRGIGEKFAANPVTGTGSMSVPLATSPGRSGFGPQLSLSYDSGSGNGPFGFGWSLSLPAITRKTDKGLPRYLDSEESDVYILSGAEDLVPVLRGDGTRFEDDVTAPGFVIHRYRPRIEGLFARIERWTRIATGEIHWRSITRDNVTTWYGKDNESRIVDPADLSPSHPTRVFSWLICESYDDKGNAIRYRYAAENDANVDRGQANERGRVRTANRYLKRILYGNRVSRLVQPDLDQASWLFEVVFDYDEGHYETLDLDPTRPEAEQHRVGLASASAGRTWTVRPDSFSSYRAGFEVRTYRRCRRVLMFHHIPDLPTGEKGYDGLVGATEIDYADLDYAHAVTIEDELAHQGSTRFASYIRAVTQSGYVRDETRPVLVRDGVEYPTYLKKSLPPLEFEYSRAAIQDQVLELDAESLENLPVGLDGASYQWIDLHGEGIPGVLTEQGDGWFYKRNLSPLPVREDGAEVVRARLAPVELVPVRPNLSLSGVGGGGQAQFMDLAGDGQPDVVVLEGAVTGLYEHDLEEGWQPFRPFTARLSRDTRDPNLKFVDLDGDGHADVLITEDDALVWHRSLAEDGFGPACRIAQAADEEQGPRLVFADGTQSIYLADMCGDGLSDLVRIRNGEVCYWPNLGYGRFGPKVTMDNSPWLDSPDQLDQRRVRLADIDGSGTNDVIYLHRDGVRLYFNQSGNRLTEARDVGQFPGIDNVTSVLTVDLLGNGTACLVWSSPLPGDGRRQARYIDLMGGTKPHLLVKSINNLGAETEMEYASSSRFYLEDKRDGRPWVTRLPFPVHVVHRVVTRDRISGNRFVTRYAYHHGYFDGVEREFRGFGMVEQFDSEEYAALATDGQAPEPTNDDTASHVPPVQTRTWFHTGVYDEAEEVSRHLAAEYCGAPEKSDPDYDARFEAFLVTLLPDTVLPVDLTPEEERECCRALKGSMLRQEIYALDGTDKEKHPYSITEQNFTIRTLQRRAVDRPAVFFTHARESISYHYEREAADPRTTQAFTLEVDGYGNVLKSVAAACGRRQPDATLAQADQLKQTQALVTCTEHRFTRDHNTGADAIDGESDYRAPLPCESRTCEITGVTLPASRDRFSFEDILEAVTAAAALEYEESPTAGRVETRPIEHVRTYYRRDDLTGPLPLGALESLALPFETCTLAFTEGLVAKVYGNRTSDAIFADGGYVHTEGDDDWWIPSGRIFYSPDPADDPAQELAHARQHFFAPHRYRDPFHTDAVNTESLVTYDPHDLLVYQTTDALGNQVSCGERRWVLPDGGVLPEKARIDYRVLQPGLVMDPNRNCSEVRVDALGMVVATAVMGKPEETPRPGDRLTAAFRVDLTQAEIDQLLLEPKGPAAAALLGDASTRIVYDLTAYCREAAKRTPVATVTLARESHASDPSTGGGTRIQVSLSYSDGFGREIQRKIPAEPGPVPQREAGGGIVVGADGLPQMTAHDVSTRWAGTGWTVFNNKGKPVRQYQPFFTDTHRFEFDVRIGISPVLFYDPVGRIIATLHPNHTWEKVVFNPWRQETWDVNDTVLIDDPASDVQVGGFFGRLVTADYLPSWDALRTDAANGAAFAARYPASVDRLSQTRAAEQTRIHAATPTVSHTDSLGRTFLTVVHNRCRYSDSSPTAPPIEEFYDTRLVLDIEGNQREVIDAMQRVVMRYDYDMLGNRIHQASMEAGERWMLNDVAGEPLYSWDSRNHRIRTAYDPLRRPTDTVLREGTGPELVVARTIYGESRPSPEAANLRGMAVELRDQGGVVTNDDYDFKKNLRRSRHRFARAYDTTLDWSGDVTVPLEVESYSNRTRYDALNRPTQLVAPHSDQPGARLNIIQPAYNEANLLERVDAWLNRETEPADLLDPAGADQHAVLDIDYDAKGQRVLIDYGNGVRTTYAYDPLTSRVVQLLTRRGHAAFPEDCPESTPEDRPGCGVQSLHYTYDPAGNITHIRDTAQQTIYFRNRQVEPTAEYTYDATYRLIEATGREHLGQVVGSTVPHSFDDAHRTGLLHPGDGNAMGRYLERYVHDAAGNLTSMEHHRTDATQPGWTRMYTYQEPSQLDATTTSNRLTSTTIGAETEVYSSAGDGYDPQGNLLRMPHLQSMRWDFKDQLRMTHQGERTWYVYDSTGQRVRKVTEAAGGQRKDERTYLGGFEIYRRHGADPLMRETLHIMDDRVRIALVESRTEGLEPGVPRQRIRYQYANHLGSTNLELDEQAQLIGYEEYAPYGATSYQAVRSQTHSPPRYRYTGKERDEQSGFYYHGARYYMPWLGRWLSPDPIPFADGFNLYRYVRCNPVKLYDPNGAWGVEMHFAGVYWSGRLAGATHTEALKAAIASQSLDDFEHTSAPEMKINATQAPPTPGRFQMNRANNAHALNVTKAESGVVAEHGIAGKNLLIFGLGLHTVGDYLPHANLSGKPSFGHQSGFNEDLSRSEPWAHEADLTFRNPRKALATFERFRGMWSAYKGTSKRPLGKDQLQKVSQFIYARDWGEMVTALHEGLLKAGVSPEEIAEVESLLASKDLRRQEWSKILGTAEGKASSMKAWSLWDAIKGGANSKLWNSTKIDISKDLDQLPKMPRDARFEAEKLKNTPKPPPKYIRYPDGTMINTETGKMLMGAGPKY